MAEKIFSGSSSLAAAPEAAADRESAARFDKLRVGRLGVYFRDGLKNRFIPYDYIDRAFIRIHEVNGKLCCGSTVFQYFRLVFVHDGKEFADLISEDEKTMDAALALIHELAPDIMIGFEEKQE